MAPHKPVPDPEAALLRLGGLARKAGSGEVPAREHARGRERLLREATRRALPLTPRPFWIAAAAAVPLFALVFALALRPAPQLSFAIDGAQPRESASYVAGGPGGATASFSEGTTIRFSPGARGRVEAVTARGACVRIEDGGAHFRVTHLEGAAWTAEAGPFTVTVTGTEFDLSWHEERLDLAMQSGAVVVRGPLAAGGIALSGRQRLIADVARGELTIAEPKIASGPEAPAAPDAKTSIAQATVAPPSAAAPAPGAGPFAAEAGAGIARRAEDGPASAGLAPSPSAAQPGAAAVEPDRSALPSLRERVARGDFAAVIADAEARGLDAAVNASSLDDLAALADAARYAGRAALAERALLAERARFPGSAEARSAAFLLGRMAEASSPAAAIGWYDRYLLESPAGPLAPEALGRKMIAVRASAGREAARPIAEEYRRRNPQGALAPVAEEILAVP